MNRIDAFKNELANYTYYTKYMQKLEDKLDMLNYEMRGVKGIRYDKTPGTPNMKAIETRKLYLSNEIEKVEAEISRITLSIMHIENILSSMENIAIRKAIIDVYIKNETILKICSDYNLSGPGLHYQMNKCIEQALNEVEKAE